jgi:predicted membrane-bound dolichyl-phosphate-mannose-protein mannosyltransferase
MNIKQIIYEHKWFLLVLSVAVIVRVWWFWEPDLGVYDEGFYWIVAENMIGIRHMQMPAPIFLGKTVVVAVQGVLTIPVGTPLFVDFNYGQPTFPKAIMALSLLIFGDSIPAMRIPSLILGILMIPIVYLIVLRLSNSSTATIAAFLLSFENLFFMHGRVGVLDIYPLFFSALAVLLVVRKNYFWSIFSVALAANGKFVGIAILPVILVVIWMQNRGSSKRAQVKQLTLYGLIGFALAAIIFLIFNTLFFVEKNPLVLLQKTGSELLIYQIPLIGGFQSNPWEWLLNQRPLSSKIWGAFNGALSYDGTAYANPLILFLAIPTLAVMLDWAVRKKDKLALLSASWFLSTYLIYYLLIWSNRQLFMFYFLQCIPPICIGIAHMLNSVPKSFKYAYLAMVLVAFVYLYPYLFIWTLLFGVSPTG